MSGPKTLLELSGADMRPAPLAGSTLVIIDAQNEYLDGKLALSGIKPLACAAAPHPNPLPASWERGPARRSLQAVEFYNA